MSKIEDGGPAFPTSIKWGPEGGAGFQGDPAGEPGTTTYYSGMTLRQYAAIKLRVPNSGTDWLDEMILTSLRDELRGKAIQAYFTDPNVGFGSDSIDAGAKAACQIANVMLAARGEDK